MLVKGNPLAVHDMESTPPAVLFDDSGCIVMTGKTEKKEWKILNVNISFLLLCVARDFDEIQGKNHFKSSQSVDIHK